MAKIEGLGGVFIQSNRAEDLAEWYRNVLGVETEGKMLVWERGKHHWIRNLDGNRIELYEELFVDEGA